MNAGGGNQAAIQLANQQQQATSAATGKINQAFAGFNPQFYNQYRQSYIANGLPQLEQQYQPTAQQAQFMLSNRGLLNSGAANTTNSALQQNLGQAETQLSNSATQATQGLQNQIAQQQSQLIGEASTANNPGSIGNEAFGIASGFQSPSTYQPLGNLFSNFGNMYLANRLANTYGPQSQPYGGYGFGYANPTSTAGSGLTWN